MRRIGLNALNNELFPVELVVFLRVPRKKCVAQDRLGRVFLLLIVQAVDTAEIGYSAFGGHARPAEKHDIIAFDYPLFKLQNFLVHFQPLLFLFYLFIILHIDILSK